MQAKTQHRAPIGSSDVLGAPVTVAAFDDLKLAIIDAAQEGAGGYACVANVHMVTTSLQDRSLRKAMQEARWVTTDGMPLVWYLRQKGAPAQRVAGPDLTAAICSESAAKNLPVYFYGGSDRTIRELERLLRRKYPGILIAGLESPPMLPAKPPMDAEALERIRRSKAKIVFVGLGCPKQEFWMQANSPHSDAVFLGVGAAFDFLAGTLKRAPSWMQRSGLEWFYRLLAEPRRLGWRYLSTNVAFTREVLRERLRRL